MNKIRINELARELEVKAHEILDRLPELGVTEKKTHSSSIDEDVAIKLRRIFGHEGAEEYAEPEAGAATPPVPEPAAIETSHRLRKPHPRRPASPVPSPIAARGKLARAGCRESYPRSSSGSPGRIPFVRHWRAVHRQSRRHPRRHTCRAAAHSRCRPRRRNRARPSGTAGTVTQPVPAAGRPGTVRTASADATRCRRTALVHRRPSSAGQE